MTITNECIFLACSHCVAAGSACSYWHKASAPEYLSNWALVGVTIVAAAIALLTLGGIRSQVKSASTAADAAAKSADAVLKSERAIIITWPHSPSEYHLWSEGTRFQWSIKNVGKTPAILLATQAIFELVDQGSVKQLPEHPKFPVAIDVQGLQLVHGDSYGFQAPMNTPDDFPQTSREINTARLQSTQIVLRCYGYVKYRDIFEQEHYARFCHYYKVLAEDFDWLLGAPNAYFEQT